MKRTILVMLGVLALSLAGSVTFAQTDYGNTNDPPAADQPNGSSTGDVTGSQSADSPTSPAADQYQDQNRDPNRDVKQTPNQYQSNTNTTDHNRKLPATGSNDPLALALGLSALGGAAMLRIFRVRKAD